MNEIRVAAVPTFCFIVGFAISAYGQSVTAYEGTRLIVNEKARHYA